MLFSTFCFLTGSGFDLKAVSSCAFWCAGLEFMRLLIFSANRFLAFLFSSSAVDFRFIFEASAFLGFVFRSK